MKQKIPVINIFKCIKELNAQKQGGDGKRDGVSIHEEMHKFKWVSLKRVVGVRVCLFFLKEYCFRVRVRVDKKLSITKTSLFQAFR